MSEDVSRVSGIDLEQGIDESDAEPLPAASAAHESHHEDAFPVDSLKAVVEAAIYITDEPLTTDQIASATSQSPMLIQQILNELVEEYKAPSRGIAIREIAGGYKMSTKPEFHDPVRQFVRNLQPPLKLSLPALETLAVVAYRQPITGPEILEIRGVQGAGVLKTLLDRKLIASAGRKNVLGKPMQYRTTKEFLVQFGLNSVSELPTLKEFEELGRLALGEDDMEEVSVPEQSGQAQVRLDENVSDETLIDTKLVAEEERDRAAD